MSLSYQINEQEIKKEVCKKNTERKCVGMEAFKKTNALSLCLNFGLKLQFIEFKFMVTNKARKHS